MADIIICTCEQCAIHFEWRRGDGLKRFCRICRKVWEARPRRAPRGQGADRTPKKRRDPTPCQWCGALTTRPKFCSRKCGHDCCKGIAPAQMRACKECGKQIFEAGNRRVFCSIECGNKHKWRKSTAIRRARLAGVIRDRFDPFTVFERDKWKCHICGCHTPKRLRGTSEDRAPELDHILPLAAGGEHSMRNTACSCRKCNMAKNDKPLGQMRLFA